jgi:hypothetical protein
LFDGDGVETQSEYALMEDVRMIIVTANTVR